MTETASRKPRTVAHTHRELAGVLGWPELHVDKAVAVGRPLPEYDRPRTRRWSGKLVDQMEADREELTAAFDPGLLLSSEELRTLLGFNRYEWTAGREHGVIPPADQGGEFFAFWSRTLADDLAARADHLRAEIPPRPLGVTRIAAAMTEWSGIQVEPEDVKMLIQDGHIKPVDAWEEFTLYDTPAAKRIATSEDGKALLAEVAARRMFGPDRAAQYLKIRRAEFDLLTAAGLLEPAEREERQVGGGFKRATVRLYRVSDLDHLVEHTEIPWAEIRSVRPGAPSLMGKYVRVPLSRPDALRAFCTEITKKQDLDVWLHYRKKADQWRLDCAPTAGVAPGDHGRFKDQIIEALAAHPDAGVHAGCVVVNSGDRADAVRMARWCLQQGNAVIVDWESTDLADAGGVGIQIAVIDAGSGAVLLNTLVNPAGAPVAPEARRVHGIPDRDLAGAPMWEDVAPQFLRVTEGKVTLAYNAGFDEEITANTHKHAGLPVRELPRRDSWWCLMNAYSDFVGSDRWLPLEGGDHSALGDVRAAREVLKEIAAARGQFR